MIRDYFSFDSNNYYSFTSQSPKASIFKDEKEHTPFSSPKKRSITSFDETPPTPIKKINVDTFENNITINNQETTLKIFSKEGSYMDVFTLSAPNNVIPNVSNEDLVVKLHNKKIVRKKDVKFRVEFLSNAISNYNSAIKLKINVAKISNDTTAVDDHFILQEKIKNSIDVNNHEHILAVRKMFLASFKSSEGFDLMPSNIRVKEDGTVVLIDFLEEPEAVSKSSPMQHVLVYINKAVFKWGELFVMTNNASKEQTRKFLMDFTSGFENFGFETYSQIEGCLNELFFEVTMIGESKI